MNKHVQIRNMREMTHRKLKAKAASQGTTISDYVKKLIDADLERLSNAELVERLRKLPPVDIGDSSVRFVREDRDNR